MATVKVLLDTRVQKSDGTYPIKLSLAHKGKTFFIGLNISVTKEQFPGSEVIDHPKAKTLNRVILGRLNLAENLIFNLQLAGRLNKTTPEQLKYILEAGSDEIKPDKPYTVAEHFKRYISNLHNAKTKTIYSETLDKILKHDPECTFNEINLIWLRSFDNALAETCGTNTRSIHMRNIRAVFNDAINEDLISLNLYPFRKFKIKSEKTIKRTLSIDQIKVLRDYPVETHQEKYRDVFVLIFYLIGINLVDLLRLRPDDLRNGRIEYIRAKTGRPYSIEVLPEAMAIIQKYHGKDYLLSFLDSHKNYVDFASRMNENLKEIGKIEWVMNKARLEKDQKKNKKKITPLFPDLIIYTARRSWATIASSLDIPKDTIAAALGHQTGSKVTDLYIDFDLKKVDKANRDVLNAIR